MEINLIKSKVKFISFMLLILVVAFFILYTRIWLCSVRVNGIENKSITNRLNKFLKDNGIGNAAISVGTIKDGDATEYYFGKVSYPWGKSPDINTMYEIGSITKTFTATLIQKEIIDGHLKLDAPFNGYIKQRNIKLPSYNNKEITISDLLSHTSGLPLQTPEVDNPIDATNPYKNTTFSSMYNYLNHVRLTSEPGSLYCYSNIGYSILGDLLSKISRKSYNELLSEEIFKKLKMSSTTLNPDDQIKGKMAQGYDINGNNVKKLGLWSIHKCWWNYYKFK
jgi:CubicO group peptidase (beta-lactamase class C family)